MSCATSSLPIAYRTSVTSSFDNRFDPIIRRPTPSTILACLLTQLAIANVGFSQNVDGSPPNGYFEGSVIVQWMEHEGPDRNMTLMDDFSYFDPDGKEWVAPAATIIDGTLTPTVINGASIPNILWSYIGPPFVGDYRRASVIHDYFCDIKSEPSEDVHRMFYSAAIAGGVSPTVAKLMYSAIVAAGPRWKLVSGFDGSVEPIPVSPPIPELSIEQIEMAERWIASQNPSLDSIDDYIDNMVN